MSRWLAIRAAWRFATWGTVLKSWRVQFHAFARDIRSDDIMRAQRQPRAAVGEVWLGHYAEGTRSRFWGVRIGRVFVGAWDFAANGWGLGVQTLRLAPLPRALQSCASREPISDVEEQILALVVVPRSTNTDGSVTCDGCGEEREPHTWRECHAAMDKKRGDAVEAWAEVSMQLERERIFRETVAREDDDAIKAVQAERDTLRSQLASAREDCSVARQSLYEVVEQRNAACTALAPAQRKR